MPSFEEMKEIKRLLGEALDNTVSQLKLLRQAMDLYQLPAAPLTEDIAGCPVWPAEVKTIYFALDPELDPRFLEKEPNTAKSKYVKLLSFLEACARKGAIVYRRHDTHFSWAVSDKDVYQKLREEFDNYEIEFVKWDRDRGFVMP